MPDIVLDILKYLFLLILFLFLTRAVKAMYLEIYGPGAPRPAGIPPAAQAATTKTGKPPERLILHQPGSDSKTFDIGDELIIGRGDKCHVVLTDTYSSQIHARVFQKGGQVFIEDMGSTNGTFLNRRKVTSPIAVARGDKARIGKTELEFKR